LIDIDSQLKRRIDRILARLATLSEAPAAKLNSGGGKTKPESREPLGFRDDSDGQNPDPEDSLLTWFVWRLERARSETAVLAATVEAEIRFERRVHRQHTRPVALAGAADTTKTRDRRIATGYSGLSPVEVSIIESESYGHCTAANVRLTRARAERDPESGEREPAERKLRGRERVARARELASDGVSQRDLAVLFGVSRRTVQGWLPASERKDAA
jgi:hypothetical protein